MFPDFSLLSKKVPEFFNLPLWMVLIVALIALSCILCLCLRCRGGRRRKTHAVRAISSSSIPVGRRRPLSENDLRIEINAAQRCSGVRTAAPDLGSGKRYSMKEIEEATNGFSVQNVIDSGNNWVVYRGTLYDNRPVAVKGLLHETENVDNFMQVQTIGRANHKNLVSLIGFCIEGSHRFLLYDYIDNGNLHQWLHCDTGRISPLTWDIRMNIIMGTAKGLSYLHEDMEPKVIHGDIKSGNIMLDHQWNPKIFNLGSAKIISTEDSHVVTHAAGTLSYLAPEYASTGVLTEKSDIYSFGVLILEIISGRSPLDSRQPQHEMHLVDWVKSMVSDQNPDFIVDPRLPELPLLVELKRVLLVALRCVDPDAKDRPKMGDVIHMFQQHAAN